MARLVPEGPGRVAMVFNPTDESQARFNGYGPSKLPNERDEEIDEFVSGIIAGGASSVLEVLPRLSEKGRQVLRAYAERMASLAVRQRDRMALTKALVALVLGGLDENRPESLMVMAPVEDSARRLHLDISELFEAVSKMVGHPATVNLMMWLTRKEEDRSLASMGFVTSEDADGFRYKLDW